jgi:fibronectin type 3 domain-containing protein
LTYFYAVQALNEIGPGLLSEVLDATPVGLPGGARGLNATWGDGEVVLTWAPPALDGGIPVLGYRLVRGIDPDHLDTVVPVQGTTYTDQGLTNGQRYCYAVRAYNRLGDGPLSEVVEATPLGLPDAPGDLFVEAGNGFATISWLIPMGTGGAPILEFNLYRGTAPSALELLRAITLSTLSVDDTDVVAGTIYYYAVSAVTEAGEGPRSPVASATPYGLPSVPFNLTVTAGDGAVSLTWSPPANDGAAVIEGYVVLRGTSPTDLRELETLTGVLTYRDRGVTNSVTYHYAVAAVNKAGRGPVSDVLSATPFKSATVPGKVRTLVAEAKGAEVTVVWTVPTDDGGTALTGYIVLRGESRDALEVVATLGAVTAWTDTAVERGSTYYYTVAAVNTVGQGEAFAAYEVKVPKEKEDSPGLGFAGTAMAIIVLALLMESLRRERALREGGY